jgi:serine/threonine-protein kinase HipA
MVPATPRLARDVAVGPVSAPAADNRLRFALAGAQWKLSVREGERGLTMPVQGETGAWIAKFHDPVFKGLPRVEHATMRWAELSGVWVPPFRQVHVSEFVYLPDGIPTGDGSGFLIERFDRSPAGERIHMEDFAQVLDRPPGDPQYDSQYEYLAAILAYLAPEDIRPYCERLVFCILCGNTDAHLKNWSLIYPNGRTPRLSPAYDLVASVLYAPGETADELALTLGGSRCFETMSSDSFRLLASVSGRSFDEVRSWVSEAAERVRTVWHEQASALPWLDRERARIEEHMARVPLGR